MSRKRIISAIDVGTTKVCTIIANLDSNNGIQVLGVGVAQSHGMHKGMVVNVNEAKEAIRSSVRRAENVGGLTVESAYIGVTGRHISSLNSKGVIAIPRNDRLVRPDDLKRVLDAARSITIPSERKILHAIPRHYALDGQVGVKNPVGMHGFRLDVETHIITAAVSSVQNLVKCIRGIGVEIEDLILEPLASGEAVLTPDEKEIGVILADIGGGTTDIAVFKGGSIFHTAVLPVAGYQFTSDIAIGLGLPFEIAEEMKRRYGNVTPLRNGEREEGMTVNIENGHTVSYKDLCNIVRTRMEEVLRLILLEMPSANYLDLAPAGLVLCGGTCNLVGTPALAQQVLRIPTRVGMPMGVYGISDILGNPAHATGVGLILWGANNRGGKPTWEPQIESSPFRRFLSRIRKLLK